MARHDAGGLCARGDAADGLSGDQVLGDCLGHGAAASVAGADEQDDAFELLGDEAFFDRALVGDIPAAGGSQVHRGWRSA